MTHVAMLLANAFRPDPRVLKEAVSLSQSGFKVTVICWDREASLPAHEELAPGVEIVRVHSVRSRYGAGSRQLVHLPRFWLTALRLVKQLKPDIIHCHDLDTLPAGWLARRSTRAKLVFDAHEDYPALMSLYLPAAFIPLLRRLELLLLKRVNGTITASTVLADRYRKLGVQPLVTVGNYQDLSRFNQITPEQTAAERQTFGLSPDDLLVAYIGGFTRNRLLIPFIQAASLVPEARFYLWGDGHQRQAVEETVAAYPNARYLGWLPADRVPLTMVAADVIYYCIKPDYPGAAYNASNTLTYAMAAGKPIIANDIGDLGQTIRATDCGLLIEDVTPGSIAAAVTKLSDPVLRSEMGTAGRRAAESQYNWESAFSHLLNLYHQLGF